jgi:hypothetical protein
VGLEEGLDDRCFEGWWDFEGFEDCPVADFDEWLDNFRRLDVTNFVE